jgi:RNA polymerase sigma-70 factor (ECF subfamily)
MVAVPETAYSRRPASRYTDAMWPNSNETQQLLAAARSGDASARNILLERHREALRRMIALRMDRKLSPRVDASDIVQDVLVEANRRLADYLEQARMPFHLWLRHLARDRLIDAHRMHRGAARRSVDREQPLSRAASETQSALDLAAWLKDRELTPAAAATHHELEARFQAAIEVLDEADREVILMRHFEQLTNGEVAQALALSEAAAGMRYLRAMRRLRSLLQEPPSEERSP